MNESIDAVVALTKLKTACITKKRELEIVDEKEEYCPESTNIAENIVDESKKKSELPQPKVVERTYDVPNTKRKVNKECLGCLCDFTKVNSRNFLSNMRSNPTTCSEHRLFAINIATARRRYHKYLMTKKESPNFNFVSSPKMNAHHINIPHEKTGRSHPEQKNVRRAKVPFSTYEIEILKKGVEKYGPRFNLIERYCEFSTKRSAKTLKQKYESLNVPYHAKKKMRCPFSLQEEDNLKAGVSRFGYKWTCIMEHYEFKKGRTPQNLKDKWRNLLKSS
ncbi:telomere repeats-binding bouquet formation protein 1-like [Xenia sp. Carnegie-2017]|uniref:telomere repeats-binding bouquet formation protein 1-like n=1 Tax=Xenia sp. Carnegie-2017 TaxID=2897299 RepID=UPI001F03B1D6|nr:telomere repeats-binding bouquet formation protein 1-like [Xenia sp. Carnegie-2017]